MKKEPFVSIIICTRNRAESLKKFALESILNLAYLNYEVVIVDDASKDKTQDIIREFENKIKNLTIVKNVQSKGLCYARNLGVKYSKGEIIAFTDDDCIVDKNWLNELVELYLKDEELMAAGGDVRIGNSIKTYNHNKEIIGCNMSFRKEVFDKFLFDINMPFKSCSCDETELLHRIKNKNLKIAYTNKAIVKHFPQPAEYRANRKIAEPLNYLYMYAKKIPLIKYYALFFITLLLGKQKKLYFQKGNKELVKGFDSIRGLFSPKHKVLLKLPWIFYILLLELPLKAKIKDWLEERKMNLE